MEQYGLHKKSDIFEYYKFWVNNVKPINSLPKYLLPGIPHATAFPLRLRWILIYAMGERIGVSDRFDLRVIRPMILCAHSTSRSREQSTKGRLKNENMWKVCLFYSENKKILWVSNMADTFLFWEIHEGRQGYGLFSWMCFLGDNWLGRQTPITWTKK